MEELNGIIANNIALLRKKFGLTQAELAQKLNYSDKAVSKWERGESVPDIYILKKLADIFEVKVDTLITPQQNNKIRLTKHISLSKTIITLLACLCVWLIATITFVTLALLDVKMAWFSFIVAVPVSLIVGLILNCIWGKKWVTFLLISLIIWSILATIYIGVFKLDLWLIFLIGIPLQIATILWYILAKNQEKNKEIKNQA